MFARHIRAVRRKLNPANSDSINRRILSATIVIALGLVVVKAAGMLREGFVAREFGLSDDVDAFLIAFVLPSFFVNVIAGSFNAAFVPTFIRLRDQQGQVAALNLFANVLIINLCLLVAVSFVMMLSGPPLLRIIAANFSTHKFELVLGIYYWLLPSIVMQGLITLFGSVLNARESFGLAALTPILTPIAVILAVAALGNSLGGRTLAWGTVAGMFLELSILGIILHTRSELPGLRWRGMDHSTRIVMRQYVPTICGATLTCASGIVDQGMASWLAPGSVAALNYANKLPALISGIGVTALGTAVLPYFSKQVAQHDFAGLRHTLRTYSMLILGITIPITAGLILSSEFLVKILFERGAFHAEDTRLVAGIQQMYLLQTPFYVLGIMGVRLLSALSKNHLLVAISTLNVVTNFVGNILFMKWFGVKGIALSSAVVYVFAMTLTGIFVARALKYSAAS